MVTTLRATFDGEVLRPERPLDLRPNATYVVTVEREVAPMSTTGDLDDEPYPLAEIGRFSTDLGVTDFAERHDWYAHGRLPDGPDDE